MATLSPDETSGLCSETFHPSFITFSWGLENAQQSVTKIINMRAGILEYNQ